MKSESPAASEDEDRAPAAVVAAAPRPSQRGPSQQNQFPMKLHRMLLACSGNPDEDIVAWLPDGESFVVKNRTVFVDRILPMFFKQTKFKSFQRQLSLWGFDTLNRGRHESGQGGTIISHPKFKRGQEDLCKDMNLSKRRNKGLKKPPGHMGGVGNQAASLEIPLASPASAPSNLTARTPAPESSNIVIPQSRATSSSTRSFPESHSSLLAAEAGVSRSLGDGPTLADNASLLAGDIPSWLSSTSVGNPGLFHQLHFEKQLQELRRIESIQQERRRRLALMGLNEADRLRFLLQNDSGLFLHGSSSSSLLGSSIPFGAGLFPSVYQGSALAGANMAASRNELLALHQRLASAPQSPEVAIAALQEQQDRSNFLNQLLLLRGGGSATAATSGDRQEAASVPHNSNPPDGSGAPPSNPDRNAG